eukprot:5568465-Amphidinium_carterae.1
MSDTLRLWRPRPFGPSHCLQASAVVLALPASYGRGRPPVHSVLRVLHLLWRFTDSEILCKREPSKASVQNRLTRPHGFQMPCPLKLLYVRLIKLRSVLGSF